MYRPHKVLHGSLKCTYIAHAHHMSEEYGFNEWYRTHIFTQDCTDRTLKTMKQNNVTHLMFNALTKGIKVTTLAELQKRTINFVSHTRRYAHVGLWTSDSTIAGRVLWITQELPQNCFKSSTHTIYTCNILMVLSTTFTQCKHDCNKTIRRSYLCTMQIIW